jgi:tRNA U34 5-methylaminomethyl-2-thiouridine-forming methyltransferase MnmC
MATAWNIPVTTPEHQELHRRLRLAAFEDERPQAEIIREAVEQWLELRETATETLRQALLQQRREARAAFEAGEITQEQRIAAEREVRQFRKGRRQARQATEAEGDERS